MKQMVQRVVCLVIGHETLLQFEHNRLSLRCLAGGHQTAGWTIGEPPPGMGLTPTPASPARLETRDAERPVGPPLD